MKTRTPSQPQHRSPCLAVRLSTVACAVLVAVGCSQQTETTVLVPASESTAAVDGAKFLLASEPAEAKDVIQVREEASDGDDVVIVGRIGGSVNPWIEGRAAFSIVDGSLKACSDIPGDACEVPWDYCCETPKLPTATALVKIVDDSGTLVKADPKAMLNVQELSTVVVQGKARRDDSGNLTVLATGVFVRSK